MGLTPDVLVYAGVARAGNARFQSTVAALHTHAVRTGFSWFRSQQGSEWHAKFERHRRSTPEAAGVGELRGFPVHPKTVPPDVANHTA